VETFTQARPLVDDPEFDARRRRSLDERERMLASGSIDAPIASLIDRIRSIPYCFTLQSCSGHFRGADGVDHHSVKDLPASDDGEGAVLYRIAYLAFCIKNCGDGDKLLADLTAVPAVDPNFVQFGCAGWFWRGCVNSYVLQVEPVRFATEDCAEVSLAEALRVETVRDRFYVRVDEIIDRHALR
jgi:hypothetical protein